MSRSSAVEAAMFKRVPDGFVFRAPTLWPFGRGRFLLADELRKAEIVARVAGPGRWKLLLAFVVWIAAYAAAIAGWARLSGHEEPTVGEVIVMFALAVVSLLICVQTWYVLTVKPVIADLPQSAERISYRDRLDAMRKSISQQSWLMAGAVWSVVCVLNVHFLLSQTHGARHLDLLNGSTFTKLFMAILSALLAARFFYLEFSGAKSNIDESADVGSESIMDRVARRLERVESDNRRLRRALVGVVALCGILAVGGVLFSDLMPRIVDADRIVLRNSKGETALLLGVGKNDMPSVGLYDAEHNARMIFGLADTGSPSLGFYGPGGKLRRTFAIGADDWGPEDVDLVMRRLQSEAPSRTVVENYLSAPGAKVWVTSATAHSRTITTGAPTIDEAKRRALEACGTAPNARDCAVVMINNKWVGPSVPATPGSPQ